MAQFKITSWNIKHMHDAIAPGGKDAARLPFIREQIAQMDPDILCITEATPDLPLLQQWAATLHVPYVVPTIPGTAEALAKLPNNPRKALCKLYGYPDNALYGTQWIWFLVKASLNLGAELQDPKIWRRFAASQYADAADQQRTDGKWGLYYWAERKAGLWNHVRQPQVLVATIAGLRVELIGAHLRSKLSPCTHFRFRAALPHKGSVMLAQASIHRAIMNEYRRPGATVDAGLCQHDEHVL